MRGPFLGGPGSPDTVSCPEVSYVDDLALFNSSECPSQLCGRVVAITDGLTEITASFGLQLNMKAGKTECILKLQGRGTAEAQRQLGRDRKQIVLSTKYANVRIVQSYCHLGIILSKSGCITPEIAKRCKAMLGAYIPIAHWGLCLLGSQPQHQVAISACFAGWHFFHGAATWPELSGECLARLEAVRCRVFRKISQHFRGPDGNDWTDRQVRLECGVPRLEVALA